MAAEDQAQELMMRFGEQGTRVIIDVTKYGLDKALHLLGIGVHATCETLRRIRTTGKVTNRTLHRAGEPIGVQEVAGRYARQLERDLKKAGIRHDPRARCRRPRTAGHTDDADVGAGGGEPVPRTVRRRAAPRVRRRIAVERLLRLPHGALGP